MNFNDSTIRGKKYLMIFTRRKRWRGAPKPPKGVKHDGMRLQNLGKWYESPPRGTDTLWGVILLMDYRGYPPEIKVGSPSFRIVGEGAEEDYALQN